MVFMRISQQENGRKQAEFFENMAEFISKLAELYDKVGRKPMLCSGNSGLRLEQV
jgi:hypothetical protein